MPCGPTIILIYLVLVPLMLMGPVVVRRRLKASALLLAAPLDSVFIGSECKFPSLYAS